MFEGVRMGQVWGVGHRRLDWVVPSNRRPSLPRDYFGVQPGRAHLLKLTGDVW
jgi:hypothetical protein